ncbi:MAG: trypsin-like peptidase domain-containing protein [Rhodoferax sp.]|nr:trypsin-like peptidase domain-containing protein [Rhodoferax sp.]
MKSMPFFMAVFVSVFFAGPLKADLPSAIVKVKPSVLLVGIYKRTDSPRFSLRGTGFVVAHGNLGSSNLAITNAHVLQPPGKEDVEAALVVHVKVGDNEWQVRQATVLEVDKRHDLALLRFDGPAAPALRLGDSGAVREGQAIAFMGFPIGGALGFSPVTHRAMVSSIVAAALPSPSGQRLNEKAILSLRDGASFDIFQLDGTAYPGNSGGPAFDPDTGAVLGVVNMVFIKGTRESALTHPSGISYAIPANHILPLLQRRQNN